MSAKNNFSNSKAVKQFTKKGLFKSIIVMPALSFETQEKREKVFLIIRRHPITVIATVLVAFLYFILGIFVMLLFVKQGESMGIEVTTGMIVAMGLLNLAILVVNFWYAYVRWYFNIFMATNKRIVDVDFLNVLDTKWSEARLTNIEDVSITTPGFWSVFFDMGDLFVQTAAAETEFEIRHVPKPIKVQDVIMDLVTAIKEKEAGRNKFSRHSR